MSGAADQPSAGVETTAFSPAEYEAMLEEVRRWLPLHLQPTATDRLGPLAAVEDLTGLHRGDLRNVVAAHVCLSAPVTAFVSALPRAASRSASASVAADRASQVVRGAIDWGATARARAGRGEASALYVTRSPRRAPDTVRMEAVAWALAELAGHARRSLGLAADALPRTSEDGWRERVGTVLEAVEAAARGAWMRDVQPRKPDAATRRRLTAARSAFYGRLLPPVVETLEKASDLDPYALTELLVERWFEPDRAWRLYEIVVALRIVRAVAARTGPPQRRRLLLGARTEPFAVFRLADGDEIQLFRGWPSPASARAAAGRRHGFGAGATVPDLVARRLGKRPDGFVLELKASRSARYFGGGLSQLLSYLAEQPALFGDAPAGWLVLPPSDAFAPHDAVPDEPLWVVAADEVAEAAADRLLGTTRAG